MNALPAPANDELARAWQFDELVREGVSLIPAYAPDWTNHNAADPGITLVELFAYFSEILAYRALRITPDAKLNLLRLLQGNDATDSEALRGLPSARVDEALSACVRSLSQSQCAVTPRDFEQAACALAHHHAPGSGRVRARALAGVDLRHASIARGTAAAESGGDVSVVLAPERELDPEVLERLCREVEHDLASRCLMTTHVHVVAPVYLHVFVGCSVALEDGVSMHAAAVAIEAALRRRFGPQAPGETGAGERPFGHALYLSEIAEVMDRADGVDWIEALAVHRIDERAFSEGAGALVGLRIGLVATLAADARLGGGASIAQRRFVRDADGTLASVLLRPWELVRVHLAREAFVRIAGDGAAPAAGRRRS